MIIDVSSLFACSYLSRAFITVILAFSVASAMASLLFLASAIIAILPLRSSKLLVPNSFSKAARALLLFTRLKIRYPKIPSEATPATAARTMPSCISGLPVATISKMPDARAISPARTARTVLRIPCFQRLVAFLVISASPPSSPERSIAFSIS